MTVLSFKSAPALDLCLAVDTTGSMGTHLGQLRRHLSETLAEIERCVPDARLGAVAFKDHGPEGEEEDYLTRTLPLTWSRARFTDFLLSPELRPGTGGGGAEAVECALREANRLVWRRRARKALLLIGDRPPHGAGGCGPTSCPAGVDWRDEVEALAARGVAIYAVHIGDHLEARRVFEYCAVRSGGAFVDLRHVRDLPSAVASVCHRLTGDLGDYQRRLARAGHLTPTRRDLLRALAS